MRRGKTPTVNTMAGTSTGSRHLASRTRDMNIHNLLNDPNDEGPPQKCQRTGVDRDVWGPANKDAMAAFESPGRYMPSQPSPMGPPGAQNTPRIQNMLNTPEPERGPSTTGEKRVGYGVSAISKIVCETCGEGFTCDSLLRKHQAKHTKPFKCKQKGCERQVSGFTSPNDLKRHENSVHKGTKGPAIGFNCNYDHCRDRNKIYFRLDNFRNHLKKLHSTRDPKGMSSFLKQAESECRVEVNPEDVHQESASEAGYSSVRSRRSAGSVSFSQRKNKKLQWVITRVDNGNLHRPRPAYYGPLEEESSDSAMEVDHCDMETTSPGGRGPSGMLPISPGVRNQGPGSPIQLDRRGPWAPVVSQESDETIARRRQMIELESQINVLNSQIEAKRREYDRLQTVEAQEAQEAQKLQNGPQNAGPVYALGVGLPSDNRPVSLNPRALEDYPVSNGEAINRYVQQSPTEEPGPHPFMPRTMGTARGVAGGLGGCDPATEPVSTMLSPPDSVASPPGEHIAPSAPQVQQASVPSVHVPYSTVPRQHIEAPPIRPSSGNRNANGGPPEKTVKCLHPGCKSAFARESELKKHRKRHTRPYGCTARYCQKQFGSKNDWKRHENSQHHRLESWKCSIPFGQGDVCKAMHFRKENFVNHLKSNLHGIKNEKTIKQWTERAYIGGSNHHVFWCGFCIDETTGSKGKIIRLKNQGLSGWDERFDHLGSHFEQGMSIRAYTYPEEGAVDDCASLSDLETDEEDSVEGQEASSPLYQLATAASSMAQSAVIRPSQSQPAVIEPPSPKKHETLDPQKVDFSMPDTSGRDSRKFAWFCCKCIKTGNIAHPLLYDLHPSCINCEHERCLTCHREKLKHQEQE